MRSVGVVLLAVLVAGGVVGPAPTADACSCVSSTVAESVRSAPAVYVGRPASSGDGPFLRMDLSRVLKGPERSSVEMTVHREPSSCATEVRPVRHVVVFFEDRPIGMSLCSEHLRGEVAVAQAMAELGFGAPVSSPGSERTPPAEAARTAPWLVLLTAAGALLFFGLHRLRSRSS